MPGLNTAGDLIAFCLRTAGINGVGQTPTAEDINDGLIVLSSMMAQWQRKRWLVPSLTDMAITSTGAQSYTIGPVRPTTLHAAYARLSSGSALPLDISLSIMRSREDYSAVALKNLTTFPAVAYLDTAWPTGRVYVWPIPAAGIYELHFVFPEALPTYSALTDPINLPPEYMQALIYGLAVHLAMQYGQTPAPANVAAMRAALNTIRLANAQIPTQVMPQLGGHGGIAAGSSPGFLSGWMA